MLNSLEGISQGLTKCSKCGECLAVCPIYRETKREGSVARGRNALLSFALEGKIPFDTQFQETLYECLLCGRCTENCTAQVPTTDNILKAREIMANAHVPFVHHLLFKHIILFPKRLLLTNRLVRLYQKVGLGYFLRNTGLGRLLGPLGRVEAVLPRVTPTFRDLQASLAINPEQPKCKVGYFLGCGTNFLYPSEGIAAVNTLRQLGCCVEIPEVFCCGLPPVTYGQGEVTREVAQKNIELLQEGNYDWIVSDCASCGSMLKDYPKLFGPTDPYFEKATRVAAKVVDYAQVILKLDVNKPLSAGGQRITYHLPCHLAHLGAGREPEEILKKMTGIEFVELPEAAVCCGAGGSYFVTHGELSEAVLRRKMENIKATGAELVVTSCPVCKMQLEHGARLLKMAVQVKHLAEIIAEASQLD